MNVEDTGIPGLQRWCHALTVSSRERAARTFITHIKTFGNSVQNYLQGVGEVTEADRQAMRELWESAPQDTEDGVAGLGADWLNSDQSDMMELDQLLGGLGSGSLYQIHAYKPAPKVNARGEPIGVTPCLTKVPIIHIVVLAKLILYTSC